MILLLFTLILAFLELRGIEVLSPWRGDFDPRPVYVRFVGEKAALEHISLWVHWFSLFRSSHIFIFHPFSKDNM
jgi:hypothetical protein